MTIHVFYLDQTFTDCMIDHCTYFCKSTYQMWLQVMDGYLFYCLKRFNFIKVWQIVCQGRSVDIKSKPL